MLCFFALGACTNYMEGPHEVACQKMCPEPPSDGTRVSHQNPPDGVFDVVILFPMLGLVPGHVLVRFG